VEGSWPTNHQHSVQVMMGMSFNKKPYEFRNPNLGRGLRIGLVAHFEMDRVIDTVPPAYKTPAVNAPSIFVDVSAGDITCSAAKIGKGLVFPAATPTAVASITNSAFDNLYACFTVCGWFRFTPTEGNPRRYTIASRPRLGDDNFYLWFLPDGDSLMLLEYADETFTSVSAPKLITDSNWHFFACGYTSFDAFLEGESQVQLTLFYALDDLISYYTQLHYPDMLRPVSTEPIYVGCLNSHGLGPTNYWEGTLDEISFFTRGLSVSELLYLYNSGVGRAYPWSPGRMITPDGDSEGNYEPVLLGPDGERIYSY
jgi:hypothetical protein